MKILFLNYLFRFIRPVTILVATFCATLGINAQPYVPRSHDIVVDTLPQSIVTLARELHADSSRRITLESERSGAELPSGRESLQLQQQALAAYRIAAETGEPRAYGHTMALLERWPVEQQKPVLIHILTAAVLQHGHGFAQALGELESALSIEPRNPQAHLMKAQISLVIADYGAAQESCLTLQTLIRYPLALNCQAQLDGVTGRAEQALATVTNMLQNTGELSPQDHVELNITAAGIAHRLGRIIDAERHYMAALQLSPGNGYTLVNYAALLIEENRPDDVVALLGALPESAMSTEMQVLLAEALSSSTSTQSRARAQDLTKSIQEVFDVALARGEALPHKEFARFSLMLVQQPAQALVAARANWAVQKEPSDTLLLAQAAMSAGDDEQLQQIARWTQRQGTEDVRVVNVLMAAGIDVNAAEVAR